MHPFLGSLKMGENDLGRPEGTLGWFRDKG